MGRGRPGPLGPWAVPLPGHATTTSHKKDRSRRKSRMDQRTRERLPVLPALAASADAARRRPPGCCSAAQATAPGRAVHRRRADAAPGGDEDQDDRPRSGPRTPASRQAPRPHLRRTPRVLDLGAVEVLRHTGIRIEELTELSHHSFIQYRLPATGELIPLLQIAPSKTDTERLLVISPELADVLQRDHHPDPRPGGDGAAGGVLRRPRARLEPADAAAVPAASAGAPGHRRRRMRDYLDHALAATGSQDASGRRCVTRFHDFRRIFITDAIMHGMPPHIAQLVVGHRDINTTMGYKAVYPEEAINGHRAFIARRRALRPSRGVPRPQRRGMGRVPRPLRAPQGRLGDLRPFLRHWLHPRARLHPLPAAAPRPGQTPPADGDPRQPDGPDRRSHRQRLGRRSRRPHPQPRRRRTPARPDGPDRRSPRCRRPPGHARIL